MLALFTIIVAMGLLGLTVYGLHRHQSMEVEYNVDRTMPLPPLEGDIKVFEAPSGRSPVRAAQPEHKPRAKPEQEKATPTSGSTWQQQLATLKKAGEWEQAFELCQSEFPLWSAYNQACILLRASLKNNDQLEDGLTALYRLAALAELLHDKSGQSQSLPLARLRQLDLGEAAELDFPYPDLGYAHLRLIRKNDIKLMHEHWGRPQQHQLPRQYHHDWWQRISS